MPIACGLGRLAAACFAAATLAGCGSHGRITGDHRVPPSWILLHVARDQRTVVVGYSPGFCGHAPRATARETAATVRIVVTELVPAGEWVCPAIGSFVRLTARLRAPLAGRSLRGQARTFGPNWGDRVVVRGKRVIGVVPNLVGLKPADAAQALRLQGFSPPRGGSLRGRAVVDEVPSPGTEVPNRRVRLVPAG